MTIIIEQKDNKCTVKIHDEKIIWRSRSGSVEYYQDEYKKLRVGEMRLDLQDNIIEYEAIYENNKNKSTKNKE